MTEDDKKKQQGCTYCKWLAAAAVVLALILLAMIVMWIFRPAQMAGGKKLGKPWGGAKGGCGCMAAGFA